MDSTERVGKKFKIYFQDSGSVLCKQGLILSVDAIFVEIQNLLNGRRESLPVGRILRMEAL